MGKGQEEVRKCFAEMILKKRKKENGTEISLEGQFHESPGEMNRHSKNRVFTSKGPNQRLSGCSQDSKQKREWGLTRLEANWSHPDGSHWK